MAHFPRIVDRSTEFIHVHFVHVHCTFGGCPYPPSLRLRPVAEAPDWRSEHRCHYSSTGPGAPMRTPSSLRAPALRSRPEYPSPTWHIVFVAMSVVFLEHSSCFLRPRICSVSQQMVPAFGRVTAGRSTSFRYIPSPLLTCHLRDLCSSVYCR